jgi:hypothetical protein
MSDLLRIGFAVEGSTDLVMLESAVAAILPGYEIETVKLQPEVSDSFVALAGATGFGWPGVYRWCREAVEKGGGSISGGPVLESLDAVVVQLDADVAAATYEQGHIEDGTDDLPCEKECPPAEATSDALRIVLLRWLGEAVEPKNLVICMPSKSLETWILAGFYPSDPIVKSGALECRAKPERLLAGKPLKGRLVSGTHKNFDMYRERAAEFLEKWSLVEKKCTQAKRFAAELRTTLKDKGQ